MKAALPFQHCAGFTPWGCCGAGGRVGNCPAPVGRGEPHRGFSCHCSRFHSTKLQESSVEILKLPVRDQLMIPTTNTQEKTEKMVWGSVAISPAGPGTVFCKVLLSYHCLLLSVWDEGDTKSLQQGVKSVPRLQQQKIILTKLLQTE